MSVNVTTIISQFDGSGDFSEWVRKAELVASLQKITELENFVPLFLVGGAFAVYERLKDGVKKDYKQLKKALVEAFSLNKIKAFEEFVVRKLQFDEPIDIYVSDICRLSNLVAVVSDDWIISKVVSGLPESMKRQFLAAYPLEGKDLADVVNRLRVISSAGEDSVGAFAQESRSSVRQATLQTRERKAVRCFRCNEVGHVSRDCKNSDRRRCFSCGRVGHLAMACAQVSDRAASSKNDLGGSL